MDIGIPRERRESEYRVGLTPIGVQLLSADGHAVYIERGAGLGAGFSDRDYEQAGARIVYQPQEAYGRAELVLKVARPTAEECEWLAEGQTLIGLLHLAAARRSRVEALLDKHITAIGYEMIQNDDGSLPVLTPISQAAGRMLVQVAGTLLQNDKGGKGILLSGVPGVPPAEVVIIGAGTLGTGAARAFTGVG
ncbi:MAG: alanine dehydrogenase, partial [Chloroflexi bacterium]|nr:alanine dehydrogenase [Chloroflexota bacterium]